MMRSAWRMVTAVVTATAATVAVGMTSAAPASAHVDDYPPIPWSVDNVVLIAPQVDFGDGNGLHLFGQPLPGRQAVHDRRVDVSTPPSIRWDRTRS
jgi:hypothetical protein